MSDTKLLTRSKPLSRAHPDYLRALARWFGLDAAPAEHAHVLDIGCGYGTHALMLAAFNPNMRIIAIDRDEEAIALAKEVAEKLALKNVRFICQDIAKLAPKQASVDYLICHDVFSYLDEDERHALFKLTKSALSERGVAYITYSTYPGWKLLEGYADMIEYRLEQPAEGNAQDDLARAHNFLALLQQHIQENHPLKPVLALYNQEILSLEPQKAHLDFIAKKIIPCISMNLWPRPKKPT
ncbi:class I SAM-dependent methyltransferase [Suttonella sp. R2A3]|uniref:class I SAM-dependent methyltransferase n=1 Tax=Suttonella sp. R2A3 TaxID=2908648 RepID=UPI001F43E256|nr:class I SAM-dependent methyltransferase [Suttonella sp. R2A3]UJF23655.1 class I SAM-dependent methyltransferase [Suttonella sp. R2A3]